MKPVDAGQTIHHKTPKVFLLKGATIIPQPGKVIAEGEIVIRDGLIESVGKNVEHPADAYESIFRENTFTLDLLNLILSRKKKNQ